MSSNGSNADASSDAPRLGPQRSYKEGVEARRDTVEKKFVSSDPKRAANVRMGYEC
jgi:hypothetical protein